MASRRMRSPLVAALAVTAAGATAGAGHTAPAPVGPPGFPDLTGYHAVDPARYRVAGAGAVPDEVVFSTLGGVECRLPDSAEAFGGADCHGAIPGLPESALPGGWWARCPDIQMDWGSASERFPWYVFHTRSDGFTPRPPYDRYQQNPPCPSTFDSPLVQPGQRISAAHITCAVGPRELLACTDPTLNRGFVLTSAGSWVF